MYGSVATKVLIKTVTNMMCNIHSKPPQPGERDDQQIKINLLPMDDA